MAGARIREAPGGPGGLGRGGLGRGGRGRRGSERGGALAGEETQRLHLGVEGKRRGARRFGRTGGRRTRRGRRLWACGRARTTSCGGCRHKEVGRVDAAQNVLLSGAFCRRLPSLGRLARFGWFRGFPVLGPRVVPEPSQNPRRGGGVGVGRDRPAKRLAGESGSGERKRQGSRVRPFWGAFALPQVALSGSPSIPCAERRIQSCQIRHWPGPLIVCLSSAARFQSVAPTCCVPYLIFPPPSSPSPRLPVRRHPGCTPEGRSGALLRAPGISHEAAKGSMRMDLR
ncbi:hypothetical protein BDY21DRAFT_82205 [Lineolata rhizophorae]|uniref:Uncharacterized protein n=1 Tax=Lineolata rhizophorae TaxID=578093 RepID=A0A6A6PBB7_9PEZI|nr:hypothetical protein BDY21DRAFT_82205 [Lineolata rhizophorae]